MSRYFAELSSMKLELLQKGEVKLKLAEIS